MKSKRGLVAICMVLYIVPSIFIASYGHPAILTQPNMSKEFVPSIEYEASNQSITSFGETLPDDVLFYPDGFTWNTSVATAGNAIGATITGDYTDTAIDDGTYYKTSRAGTGLLSITLNFSHGLPFSLEWGNLTIDIQHNIAASTNEMAYIWNFALGYWDSGVDTSGGNGYFNFTLTQNHVENGLTRVKANETAGGGGSYLWVDYALCGYSPATMLSDNSYLESFADVSDWTLYANEGTDAKSSDGDVLSWTCNRNANPDSDYIYTNVPSLVAGSYYVEFRYRMNSTAGPAVIFYAKTGSDFPSGDGLTISTPTRTTTWTTVKVLITPTAILESIYIYTGFTTHQDFILYLDYLRIGKSTEMGYQHDCSVLTHTTNDGVSLYSDADLLRVINLNSGNERVVFNIDETSTRAKIDPDYYPMLGISISSLIDGGSDGEVYRVQVYSDTWYEVMAIGDATGILHCNVRAVTSADIEYIAIQMEDPGDEVFIDWVKPYSIANYTVTQSGISTDDVLYVEDGSLYCSGTSFTSFILDHDPALSVEAVFDSLWDITTSSGTPESDYYVNGAWAGYSSETSGTLADGTLTDFRLKFTDTANVEAITFLLCVPQWRDVGEVELLFSVPIDETGLDMLLIFLGLIMIPFSTLYLVKGGKSGMSRDKLFYGLIAFVMGWALFLGGIMP